MSLPAARQLFRALGAAPEPALPYDAEVKWLESTGTQFIDTGVALASDVGFSVDGMFYVASQVPDDAYPAIVGAQNSSGDYAEVYVVAIGGDSVTNVNVETSSGGTIYFGFGTGGYSPRFDCRFNYLGDGTGYLGHDGSSQTMAYVAPPSMDSTVCLFCLNDNGTAVDFSSSRIFGAKVTRGSSVVRDLIPVRFTNELGEPEGAMYDRISERLFRNQGTGKFVVGADVGMPYDAEVGWLLSDGTSYVQLPDRSSLHGTNFGDFRGTFETLFLVERISGVLQTIFASHTSKCIRVMGLVTAGAAANNIIQILFHGAKTVTVSDVAPGSVAGVVTKVDDSGLACDLNGVKDYYVYPRSSFTNTVKIQAMCPIRMLADGGVNANTGEWLSVLRHCTVARVYVFRYLDGSGNAVFDLKPVVLNGVGYFYDAVSGALYGNSADSGSLVAGGVVSNEGQVPYARRVQYIETDGVASYIDTGVNLGVSSKVDVRFQFGTVPSTDGATNDVAALFGQRASGAAAGNRFASLVSQSGRLYFRRPNTDSALGVLVDSGVHDASVSWGRVLLDGQEVAITSMSQSTSYGTDGFCLGKDGVIDATSHPERYYAKVRIHSCVLRTDGVNVSFNGIPVVDRNGVACMYDYISKTLKYNAASSGTITAGPPLV